jgi:release factor glutamine methyltransferase
LHELPSAEGVGVDLSLECLLTARGNADRLGIGRRASFVRADWADAIAGKFDVVVSNPPYIPDAEIGGLEPEVAESEPRLALAGGADGHAAYRRIGAALPSLLAEGGHGFLEIAFGALEPIAAILESEGLQVLEARNDLAGAPRCVTVAAAKAAKMAPPKKL